MISPLRSLPIIAIARTVHCTASSPSSSPTHSHTHSSCCMTTHAVKCWERPHATQLVARRISLWRGAQPSVDKRDMSHRERCHMATHVSMNSVDAMCRQEGANMYTEEANFEVVLCCGRSLFTLRATHTHDLYMTAAVD